jgi:hypothetical protein
MDKLDRASRFFPANIPMVVIDKITPMYDIEKRGNRRLMVVEVVNALYKTSGWVCVKCADGGSGFVLSHSLRPFASPRSPSEQSPNWERRGRTEDRRRGLGERPPKEQWYEERDSSDDSFFGSPRHHPLQHDVTICSSCDDSCFSDYDCPVLQTSGEEEDQHHFGLEERVLKVLFDYEASHFDDVSVRQHEIVTSSDHGQGWIWISRTNGEQGYIPKTFVVDLTTYNSRYFSWTSYF